MKLPADSASLKQQSVAHLRHRRVAFKRQPWLVRLFTFLMGLPAITAVAAPPVKDLQI